MKILNYINVIKNGNLISEKIKPLCLYPFNTVRECLFKSDGNAYHCKKFIDYYVNCQKNQTEYYDFLKASTISQKKFKDFNFRDYPGVYDKS